MLTWRFITNIINITNIVYLFIYLLLLLLLYIFFGGGGGGAGGFGFRCVLGFSGCIA